MCSKPPAVELHPTLSLLVGTWKGEGKGEYPNIQPFTYTEQIKFKHHGKPFLQYTQSTFAADNTPLHFESGYLKVVKDALELLVVDPVGVAQLYTGQITTDETSTTLTFLSSSLLLSPSAKEVKRIERVYKISKEGTTLESLSSMEAVEQPFSPHLSSSLSKLPPKTKQITPSEITNTEEYTIVDVREASEFESGHIPNAINIPLGVLASSIKRQGSTVYELLHPKEGVPSKPIIAHCAHGFRGDLATQLMRKTLPSVDVLNLAGGYFAWYKSQCPKEE